MRVLAAITTAAVTAMGLGIASAQQSNATPPPATDSRALLGKEDAKFFEEAAASGLAAAQQAQTASQSASNPAVKEFAKKVEQEKMTANEELKKLAQSKKVPLPDSPHADQQSRGDKLKEKKGEEFDRAYMDQAVEQHEADVQLFERAAKDSTDPEIKEFAARSLPKLRELQLAGEMLHKQTKRSTRPSWLPEKKG